jgi:hypothetical protein
MKSVFFLLLVFFSCGGIANDKIKAVEFSAHLPFANVKNFVSKFQKAVKDKSCFGISELTDYPLTINYESNSKKIWNRTALCRYFPALFDEARSDVVLNQNVLDMPVGYRGLMFGNGIFWIRPVCKIKDKELSCFTTQKEIILKLQVANIGE